MLDWLAWGVSWLLIAIGCVFLVGGAVGLLRLPDLYTRLHASSVTDTGGAIFIILGLMIQAISLHDSMLIAFKLLLVLFFTLFTTPTATHALAKTALLCGLVPLDENGEPIVDSSEKASQLARSRPET